MNREALTELLAFLNSIEGAGYGCMADFEVARMHVKDALHDQWLPLETAPTDGTPILGYSPEGVVYVCWHRKGNWVFFRNHRGDEWHFEPTEWMPMPALPSEAPPSPDLKASQRPTVSSETNPPPTESHLAGKGELVQRDS